jgi:hypothetical protein
MKIGRSRLDDGAESRLVLQGPSAVTELKEGREDDITRGAAGGELRSAEGRTTTSTTVSGKRVATTATATTPVLSALRAADGECFVSCSRCLADGESWTARVQVLVVCGPAWCASGSGFCPSFAKRAGQPSTMQGRTSPERRRNIGESAGQLAVHGMPSLPNVCRLDRRAERNRISCESFALMCCMRSRFRHTGRLVAYGGEDMPR